MKKKGEIEIENKEVFIKIEPSDSVDMKRELLGIMASNVNMQIIAERFKEKRKDELKERTLAKRKLGETSSSINDLIEKLPKSKEIPSSIKKEMKAEIKGKKKEAISQKETKKETALTKELEEIRKRIASL